eukprot:PhM_4_TR7715/c0_g2_i1/m.15428
MFRPSYFCLATPTPGGTSPMPHQGSDNASSSSSSSSGGGVGAGDMGLPSTGQMATQLGMSEEDLSRHAKIASAMGSYKTKISPNKKMDVQSSTRALGYMRKVMNKSHNEKITEEVKQRKIRFRVFRAVSVFVGLGILYVGYDMVLAPTLDWHAQRRARMQRRMEDAQKFKEAHTVVG